MGLNIAILGSSSRSLLGAPWGAEGVELWAGASFYKYHPQFSSLVSRWFEIHPNPEQLRDGWLGWAIENQCTCVLQEPHSELENSSAYPIDAITDRFGRYFTSTVAYMIAAAIHEEAERIFLFGVDMNVGREYTCQRACCEYLVGLARGMGVEVSISDRSPLLQSDDGLYGYDHLDPEFDVSCRNFYVTPIQPAQ